MKYKFDIQKDGGVEPVNWDKIDLPRSGPTRYPSEPQPDRQEQCLEQYRNGDPKPLTDYLDELKAGFVPDETSKPLVLTAPSKAFLEAAAAEDECCISVGGLAVKLGLPVHPVLQEPVGPTPKFNPNSKAWEMPEIEGKNES